MIKYIEGGNIFDSKAEALINPVNCCGFMGRGLALEYKKRFPESISIYKKACETKRLRPGHLVLVKPNNQYDFFDNKNLSIILFPTKDHWRGKSKIEWIKNGLVYLKKHYKQWGIKSVAMPQIGCGLGGLEWHKVRPLVEKYLGKEKLDIEVYLSAIYRYKEK